MKKSTGIPSYFTITLYFKAVEIRSLRGIVTPISFFLKKFATRNMHVTTYSYWETINDINGVGIQLLQARAK